MPTILGEGLTYDDVLLVPRRSAISSRKDVDTSTKFSRNINLSIPIVSANMDTVTESRLAISMARFGGLGIIHRFLSIENQVREVEKVKRFESHIVERPYTLGPNVTLREAKMLMREWGVSGVPVVGERGELLGMLTSRDVRFENNDLILVRDCMTPRNRLVVAAPGIDLAAARDILRRHKIEKLPIIDENEILRGLVTSKDIIKISEHPLAAKNSKGQLRVGAAIGVKNSLPRAQALVAAGADVLVVDVAHGHAEHVFETIKLIRKELGSVELVAGNVATPEAAKELAEAGVDAIKIGVGPGAYCSTRIVAGVGVPQLSAVMECAEAVAGYGIPIIADGGIRYSGDIVKALAGGASSVMIGNLFAGTDESPGITVTRHGQKYKIGRGMASLGANIGRRNVENENTHSELSDYVAEGVEAMVPYRGVAREVVTQLVGGLRSGRGCLNA